ncbi:MAG: hypothetical protein GWP67_06335 [Gammaproteobacteria bacterium]|nr:hypothetical protein [Gammaproteobacteria bacterium]
MTERQCLAQRCCWCPISARVLAQGRFDATGSGNAFRF